MIRRGLILTTFYYDYSYQNQVEPKPPCIHEVNDKEVFIPDGINVAYILSNEESIYPPEYKHYDKVYIQEEKLKKKQNGTKRGRKPKPPSEKKSKKTHFMSAITFGVISPTDPTRVHGVKMFRINCGNIANLKYDDSDEYVEQLVNKLFRFIEARKPGLTIKYNYYKKELANTIEIYAKLVGQDKLVINMHELRRIIDEQYGKYYWGCLNFIVTLNDQTALTIKFAEVISISPKGKTKTTKYTCKITPKGKLYVYGGNSGEVANKYVNNFWKILEKHEDLLIAEGYPASKKNKKV